MSNIINSHPRGLYVLFFTEAAERFSYYGMRAIFTLYMINALLLDKAFASTIYGNYTGLVYLTPLIGGYVADRYWGNRRSILIGGILMAIGQFVMFGSGSLITADPHTLGEGTLSSAKMMMYLGLGLLIFGNGFFKPNISTMVGQLYPKGDKRVDSAFTIFYMGINFGAFIAPLVCGSLGDTGSPLDFKWGFLAAGIGMTLSTIFFYFTKDKYIVTSKGEPVGMPPAYYKANPLADSNDVTDEISEIGAGEDASTAPPVATPPAHTGNPMKQVGIWAAIGIALFGAFHFALGLDIIGAFMYAVCLAAPGYIVTDPTLTKTERDRIWVIVIMAFFVIFFWAAFEQAGASLTFFAEEQTNRNLFGAVIPTSYFQSINAVAIVIFAPLFAALWTWLGARNQEPTSLTKQAIGLFLLAMGYVVIAIGVKGINPETKVSMMWLVSLYVIHTFGELCLSPIGLSMVVKLAPARLASLLMGVWFLSTATANKFAGMLSSFYPDPTKPAPFFMGIEITGLYEFFLLFVVMAGAASILLFAISKPLQKMMHGVH